MGGEAPAANYYPGDEINLRVTFASDSQITAVEVVYAHPTSPWVTITLEGGVDLEEDSPPQSGRRKQMVAVVRGTVEEQHLPGNYVAARVLFYTFTGSVIIRDRVRAAGGPADAATLPGRWPELMINRAFGEVFDVGVELEPEGE